MRGIDSTQYRYDNGPNGAFGYLALYLGHCSLQSLRFTFETSKGVYVSYFTEVDDLVAGIECVILRRLYNARDSYSWLVAVPLMSTPTLYM